jgi:predicted RNase H-like HicB family nuclease
MDTVSVVYHHDPEAWWADSPDLPGWTATAETLDELRALADEGVRFSLDRDDVIVEHLLNADVPRGAVIVFDFAAGQVVLAGAGGDLGLGAGAHWQTQPA